MAATGFRFDCRPWHIDPETGKHQNHYFNGKTTSFWFDA
jgi:hypothetical protein